ncbi:unnamed protein product [Didymodactylos carnosus]|uniref:Uncharacterized protein n=1 Tax=Didymodactylos carnosus TaxID=1234261 RepID=A0A8S2HUY2_9BILA|nr:unnamed protein product [Didymodactylos carnosus]CAF3669326.1 unnamed protein product [Didymodactylos carnosus]
MFSSAWACRNISWTLPAIALDLPWPGRLPGLFRVLPTIYLHYPNDSDRVVLFRSINEHDHTNADGRKVFLDEAKQTIEELFDLRLKPKKICEAL